MIDKTAFLTLSYGLYIVSSLHEAKAVGCVANTFAQITSDPAQVSIALNKRNVTTSAIKDTMAFEVCVLAQSASMELISTFGFHSSLDTDKFASWKTDTSDQGIQFVSEQACAHFSVRVVDHIDVGTHIVFFGEVIKAEKLSCEDPMTYAYYHLIKGGKTPPKASSYNGGEIHMDETKTQTQDTQKSPRYAWRCTICGHIEYVDELPDDFICPLCGVGKESFERIEV